MFIKITCSNGYCGCDEEFYEEVANADEAEELAEEILETTYSFNEPEERFVGEVADADYEEACEEYYQGLSYFWIEISESTYRDYTGE